MIIGKNDPVLDYKTALVEAKETNCKIVEFEDGHMSHIENKEELILGLKEFLKRE